MSDSKNDSKPIKESEKFQQELVNKDVGKIVNSNTNKYVVPEKTKDTFHLNALITKNISLFTKNPNYKMLTWLMVQLIIFSLFVLAINIFKNNLIPYFNS